MDGGVDPVPPSDEVVNVDVDLVDVSLHVGYLGVGTTRWPASTGHQAVQLWEVTFWNRCTPVGDSLHTRELVAETFKVVPIR